jgi:tripartite-type tricarboxylate transporter receptor subunit TctC
MNMKITGFIAAAVLLLCVSGVVFANGEAEGAEFPTKNITYMIPFNPGGQSDITAQYQKELLEEALGVSVVIKHIAGAGGAVGWSTLAKAKPDGYTLSGNNLPHIIAQPLVRDDAGYETEQLEPLYLFQTTPIGLTVLKDSRWDNLDEFISYAKSHPGEITIGGSGTYSGHHIAYLMLQDLTGAEFTYIASTGAAPSVANFLGGHTDALFANSNDLVSHNKDIIVLGIGTEERFSLLPDAPTFIEQGIDMTSGIDRGVCVPQGTPGEVIAVLEDAFRSVCTDPAFMAKMEEMGMVSQNLGAAEYKAYIEKTTVKYQAILEQLGVL